MGPADDATRAIVSRARFLWIFSARRCRRCDGTEIGIPVGMKHSFSNGFVRIAAATLALCALSTPAFSQEQRGWAKEGGYVAVSTLLDFTFDGKTFDGESYYQQVDGDEFMILPRLNGRNLVRGILGFRAEKAALELSYDRTNHDGSFLEGTGEATFQSVNVDGRFFLLTKGPVQPHVLVGGSIPWLTVKDGGFLNEDVGDARFRGYGVNTEAGVTVYPHPRMGIGVGYSYRVMWFDRATGVSETLYDLRPRFRETSGSVVMTGSFTF